MKTLDWSMRGLLVVAFALIGVFLFTHNRWVEITAFTATCGVAVLLVVDAVINRLGKRGHTP